LRRQEGEQATQKKKKFCALIKMVYFGGWREKRGPARVEQGSNTLWGGKFEKKRGGGEIAHA